MDGLKLLAFLLILSSAARGRSSLVAQEYWGSVLPNTPMPKAVRDHLHNLIPAAGLVAVDSATETNPGILVMSQGEQVAVDAATETNPGIGILVMSQGKQVAVDAATETNPGIGILVMSQGKQVAVDAATETNPGIGILVMSQGKQVAVDAATETNPGIGIMSQGKQVAVDGDGLRATYASGEARGEGKQKLGKNSAAVAGTNTAAPSLLEDLQSAGEHVSVDAAAAKTNPDSTLAKIFYYPNQGAANPKNIAAADAGHGGKQIPAPAAVTSHSGSSANVANRIDRPLAPAFFLEKDLHRGAKLWFWASRGFSGDYFLPRRVAESIPFSSARLSDIMRSFSVRPESMLARRMKETLRRCEMPAPEVEKMRCATSLESMVDFATSVFGARRLGTASTAAGPTLPGQFYTISSWSAVPMAGETSGVCHAAVYPYTVLHCHSTPASRPYRLRLVAADGTAVAAVAMCHLDTSAWDPSLPFLAAFSEKPGGAAMCHLLPEGDILWYAEADSAGDRVASA